MSGRIPNWALLGTLLAVALAGCLGGSSGSTASDRPPAVATEDAGAIEGVVMDDEQLPVFGATVGLHSSVGEPLNQTITSRAGAFVFLDLEPNTYTLIIRAPRFEPEDEVLDVAAAQVSQVTVSLLPIPDPVVGYVETFVETGFIACSVSWDAQPLYHDGPYTANLCEGLQDDKTRFQLPLRDDLPAVEYVLELVWEPASAASGSTLRMNICGGEQAEEGFASSCRSITGDNPYYKTFMGSSPLEGRRDDLPVEETTTYEVTVGDGWAGLVNMNASNARVPVTLQQSFDLYMSLCYHDYCPAGFQARPSA